MRRSLSAKKPTTVAASGKASTKFRPSVTTTKGAKFNFTTTTTVTTVEKTGRTTKACMSNTALVASGCGQYIHTHSIGYIAFPIFLGGGGGGGGGGAFLSTTPHKLDVGLKRAFQ